MGLLLQILLAPLVAVVLIVLTRRTRARLAGWIATSVLLYTTALAGRAAAAVAGGEVM